MSDLSTLLFPLPPVPIRHFLDEHGDPWFIAKDVCDVLGLDNVTAACKRLPEGSVRVTSINPDNGLSKEMNVINEPGLYWLVVRSDKPQAVPFIHWVTHEVLPAIRKTGTYTLPGRGVNAALNVTRWGWQPIRDVVRDQGYTHRSFVQSANALDLPGVDTFNHGNFVTWMRGICLPAESLVSRAEKLLNVPRERLFTPEVLAAYPTRGVGRRH